MAVSALLGNNLQKYTFFGTFASEKSKKLSNLVPRAVVHAQKSAAGVGGGGACWGYMRGAAGH